MWNSGLWLDRNRWILRSCWKVVANDGSSFETSHLSWEEREGFSVKCSSDRNVLVRRNTLEDLTERPVHSSENIWHVVFQPAVSLPSLKRGKLASWDAKLFVTYFKNKFDVCGSVHHRIHEKNPTRCNNVSKFISYLYKAQQVSGDRTPIIRSLKLH
jgi:hypothetical protein